MVALKVAPPGTLRVMAGWVVEEIRKLFGVVIAAIGLKVGYDQFVVLIS